MAIQINPKTGKYNQPIAGLPEDLTDKKSVSQYIFENGYRKSIFDSFTKDGVITSNAIISRLAINSSNYATQVQFPRSSQIYGEPIPWGGVDVKISAEEVTYEADLVTAQGWRKSVHIREYLLLKYVSQLNKLKGKEAAIATNIDKLISYYRRNYDTEVLRGMTWNLYPPENPNKVFRLLKPESPVYVNGMMPRACRVVCGNESDNAYEYDKNKTLPEVLTTALTNKETNRMSVDHIMKLRKAALANEYRADRIEPVSSSFDGKVYADKYILIMGLKAAAQLRKNEEYRQLHATSLRDYGPGQGSALNNASYLGRVLDVDCYEVPLLDHLYEIDLGEYKAVWSLLLGGGAVGSLVMSEIDYSYSDDEENKSYSQTINYMLGAKALCFSTNKTLCIENIKNDDPVNKIEQGVIHSFTVI